MESQEEVQRLKAQVHEWQSAAASWKHEYEQQSQALRRANAANAAAANAAAAAATRNANNSTASNGDGGVGVQEQRHAPDIGRPLRRVMSQMFEFYDATLERTKASLLQFLNGPDDDALDPPPRLDSAPAVTAGFIARSWKQLYADEKDVSPAPSSSHTASSLVQQASALVLRHRSCFPTLASSEGRWCYAIAEKPLTSSKPFNELVGEAVEMEKTVASKESAITQHQLLLQDLLAFHDRVSIVQRPQHTIAAHSHVGQRPQSAGGGATRASHAAHAEESENKFSSPSHSLTSTVAARSKGYETDGATHASPTVPGSGSPPRSQGMAPLVVSLDMTLLDDDAPPTKHASPSPVATGTFRTDFTPERSGSSERNTRTPGGAGRGGGPKSAAKATEFVSPVERARIPVPTLQPSLLRSAPGQISRQPSISGPSTSGASTSDPGARVSSPLSKAKPRGTTSQRRGHGKSVGQRTPRLSLNLEDSEVTDLSSVASPSPNTTAPRSNSSTVHSQPPGASSVVLNARVTPAEPAVNASTTGAPSDGTPSPKVSNNKKQESGGGKAPSSPQDIIESLKWQVRNRLENLKLSMAETHAHTMAQQAKSPEAAARSGFDTLTQRTPVPSNVTMDHRPPVVNDRSPQAHNPSGGIDDVDQIEAIVGVRTKRLRLPSGEVDTVIQ